MAITFAKRLDLLDLHGRVAVASLGQLGPTDTLPPRGVAAHPATREHWATLEIWAWSLGAIRGSTGAGRPDAASPARPRSAGGGDRLPSSPDSRKGCWPPDRTRPIDFSGPPGTTGQVARLLAHEAIGVAHAASLAAGRVTPDLSPAVATDGVDRALAHWAEPDAHVGWRPDPVVLRATDTAQAWYLECRSSGRGDHAAFRPTGTRAPGAIVSTDAATLLWWMHGYPTRGEPRSRSRRVTTCSSTRCGWGWATTWAPDAPSPELVARITAVALSVGRAYRGAMTRLTPEGYLDHIRAESARSGAVLADADPGRPGAVVPRLGRRRPALAPRQGPALLGRSRGGPSRRARRGRGGLRRGAPRDLPGAARGVRRRRARH